MNSWKGKIKKIMDKFNDFTPNLRFAYDSNQNSISFLGLIITVKKKFDATIYTKATDCYQYLHYASTHPEHTKRSVVFSGTLRMSRLCSEENNFKNFGSKLKSWFLKRKYPEKRIENEMTKGKFCKEGIKKYKGVS